MNKEQMDRSFNALNPTQEQKDRMLENILAHTKKDEVEKEDKNKVIHLAKRGVKHRTQWIGIAAGLILIVGVDMVWKTDTMFIPEANHQQSMQGAESPMGMRKLLGYEGYRYAFLNDGDSFTLTQEELGEKLGQVAEDATFAQGGVIYTLKNYDPAFRLAIEWEGNYYIAERVAKVDDSEMDIEAYVESMALENNLDKVVISGQMGMEVLKTLSEEEAMILAESFGKAQIAQLQNEDYEEVIRAQSEGGYYKVSFVLKDGTAVESYVIPSMNYVTIGDYTCTVENLSEEIGSLFEGLMPSELVPME